MCAARGRREEEEEEEGEEREPVARREWECRIEEGTVAIAEAPRSGADGCRVGGGYRDMCRRVGLVVGNRAVDHQAIIPGRATVGRTSPVSRDATGLYSGSVHRVKDASDSCHFNFQVPFTATGREELLRSLSQIALDANLQAWMEGFPTATRYLIS